jgi:phage shock protein A
MSALDDLKAADARIHDVVSAAKAAIANLGEQNAVLKSEKAALEGQVTDLTARLAAAADEAPVAAVAVDLNAAADELSALLSPPVAVPAQGN